VTVRKNFIDQIHVNNYIMFLNATLLDTDSFPFSIQKFVFYEKNLYKICLYKMLIIYYCKIHNLINY